MFSQGQEVNDLRPQRRPSKTQKIKARSPSFKNMKIKSESEALFGDFTNDLEKNSIQDILSEYKKNPFYRTKLNVVLCDLDNHLKRYGFAHEVKCPEQSIENSEKYQTLKNLIDKANLAYTMKLLKIKEALQLKTQ